MIHLYVLMLVLSLGSQNYRVIVAPEPYTVAEECQAAGRERAAALKQMDGIESWAIACMPIDMQRDDAPDDTKGS